VTGNAGSGKTLAIENQTLLRTNYRLKPLAEIITKLCATEQIGKGRKIKIISGSINNGSQGKVRTVQ